MDALMRDRAKRNESRARMDTFSPSDHAAMARLFPLSDVDSGEPVTAETSLGVSAVWRAVSLISGTVGKLPLLLFRRYVDDLGLVQRDIVLDTPKARMLSIRPNPEMSPSNFWSSLIANALLWGNGLAEIQRDGQSRAVGLWPIHWSRVTMRRFEGRLRYVVATDRDMVGRDTPASVSLPPEDVIHVSGLTFNGLWGLSVIEYARQSMGLTIAADKYGAKFFGNSGRPSGVLTHPGQLGTEAATRLRESWSKQHGGQNSSGTAILEEGMKYERIGMPPEDAQFIQTRGVQVVEVARWYGVPPHKLYSLDRATFSNIEHQGSEFREDTIHPWATKVEQEINYKILTGPGNEGLYCQFDLDMLAVPTMAERATAYQAMRQAGWINADEIRSRERMSPLPGGAGQTYWHPVNMAVVGADGLPILAEAPSASADPVADPASDPGDEPAPSPALPPVSPDDENRVAHLVPIFGDVADRVVRREERAKAASKAEDKAEWLAGWAAKHREWVADQLLPAIRAAMMAMGIDDRDGYAVDAAKQIAGEWCHDLVLEQRSGDWPERAVSAAIEAVKVMQ